MANQVQKHPYTPTINGYKCFGQPLKYSLTTCGSQEESRVAYNHCAKQTQLNAVQL